MNEQYLVIIQDFIAYWNLNRQTATLLATALIAVARTKDDLNTAKTLGIMMAYNAAGLIDENTYQEGYNLVDTITKLETEREAIDAIYNYFDECDRGREATRMTVKDKLALMREIEQMNTERLRKAGLLRKKGTEVRRYEESA